MTHSRNLSRRSFLAASAAGAAAAGLARCSFAKETAKKVIVGGHTYVYAAQRADRDISSCLEQIFDDMKSAGLEGVEFQGRTLMSADNVKRIAELTEKYQLPVIGGSFSGVNMWDRSQQKDVLEQAEVLVTGIAKLGGRIMGTSVGPIKWGEKIKKTPEQLDAQAECLRRIIPLCEANGVELNLHNHTYEVENDLYDLKGTLERVPGLKLGPDLGWLARAGVDPAAFIRQYGSQIVFLHLRDMTADNKWAEAMGEGAIDHAAIRKALQEINFSSPVVIELAPEKGIAATRPIRESLAMSRAYVKKTFGY